MAYDDDIERTNKSGQPLIPKELWTDNEGRVSVPKEEAMKIPLFAVQKLFWNPQGSLLGLLLKDLKSSVSTLLVYTRSNFTWCLKLRRECTFESVQSWFKGDSEIRVLGEEGQVMHLQFEWVYQIGSYSEG